MTHGDKTKAKTVKGSKASGQQKGTSQGVETRKAGAEKGNGKSVAKSGKADAAAESSAQKSGTAKAGSEKGSRTAATKEGRGRSAPSVSEEGIFITNPVIASAFSRAVEKYPNAFRKLTD